MIFKKASYDPFKKECMDLILSYTLFMFTHDIDCLCESSSRFLSFYSLEETAVKYQ